MRALRLRTERLAELTTDELAAVVGGLVTTNCTANCVTVLDCLTEQPRCF